MIESTPWDYTTGNGRGQPLPQSTKGNDKFMSSTDKSSFVTLLRFA